jgi:F-type H+-transporting ATPase subunit gamma
MSSTQQIRSRIKSVKNTRQITKAMQLVSASKLRRMQEAAEATKAYSKYAREILTNLKQQHEVGQFEFYQERPVKKRLLIIVTSDRGLAGAYNSNVFKMYLRELKKDDAEGIKNSTICFGRQGSNFVTRLKDTDVLGIYTNLPDKPELANLEAGINTAIDKFLDGEVDAVDVIYTHYVNTITQQATMQRLLPAGFTDEPVSETVRTADFEPSMETVLLSTTVRLIEAQLLQAFLEANVSEQAMRMVAMKNATDNAGDLIDEYTLALNNARQAAITQELAEISGGVEAMK